MNAQRQEKLRKRYGYEQWGRPAEGGEVRGFQADRGLLPGWKLERADPVPDAEGPRLVRSIWTRGEGVEEVLDVEIWECGSAAEAREVLLEVLDQFESPHIERVEGPGEIAFAQRDSEAMLLFLRANLVVRVRSVGRNVLPVTQTARELDSRLATGGDRLPR